MTERPYRLIDAHGVPHPRRFAYGVPTESVHWVTAAGIRPGVGSVTLEDSDAIAAAVLAVPQAHNTPATPAGRCGPPQHPCPRPDPGPGPNPGPEREGGHMTSPDPTPPPASLSAHLDAGLLSPVRAGTPVEAAVGDVAWLQAMLDAEAALARAQARLGTVPAAAAAAVTAAARAEFFDVRELALAGAGRPRTRWWAWSRR